MRRTFIFAFLLVALAVSAGASQVTSAPARRRPADALQTSTPHKAAAASASSRKTATKKAKKPVSAHASQHAAAQSPAAFDRFAAGYRAGYVAGRSSVRTQLAGAQCANTRQRPSAPAHETATSPQPSIWPSESYPTEADRGTAPPGNTDEPPFDQAASEAMASPASARRASFQTKRPAVAQPLRGSFDSLQRQNNRLDAEGLERIEDEHDLDGRIAHKLLVPVPASAMLTVNPNLPMPRRYCRPWTARFLADLARAHAAAFHSPLEVSSAVRTVDYQKRLMATNGNAAPAEGDVVSPHLTGAAVDIAKGDLSRQELGWMRQHLLDLQKTGKIDVEEEFQQSCFHITVYKSYIPPRSAAKAAPAKQAPVRSRQATAGRRRASSPADEVPASLPAREMASAGQ